MFDLPINYDDDEILIIKVDDLLEYINDNRDNGNMNGGGFSAALFLSKLIKKLEEVKRNG